MTQDPFDDLGRQLVAAAGRTHRRRIPRRALAVALAGVSIAGTATAAVVATQGGEPSAPAAGPLPVPPGAPQRSRTYEISVAPDLRPGAVGWCYAVQLRRDARRTSSGTGCGPAWTSAMHLYGGGTGVVPGGVLSYAVVPPDVATVVFAGGRRVVPRADGGLPYDWRIAVLTSPGERFQRNVAGIDVLDSAGQELPQSLDSYARGAPVRRLAGRAEPFERSTGGTPLCRLDGAPRGFRVVAAAVATGQPRVPELRDPAFLTCASTQLRRGRTRLQVAVLLDAKDPARAAAPLPAVGGWSVRRVERGWLVAAGGDKAQRRAALAAAQVRLP